MKSLLMTSLEADSAAERAGLRVGDYLTHINGFEINSNMALSRELTRLASGRTATINRAGQDIDLPLPDGRLGMLTEERLVDLAAARRAYAEESLAQNVAVVTLESVDGTRIEQIFDLVTAEYAVGMNIIKDVMVSGRDLFGGRSQTVQDALREAKKVCIAELRQQAFDVGANAVLGVRMQHAQMSGIGTTMLLVVMSGTAVRISWREGGSFVAGREGDRA